MGNILNTIKNGVSGFFNGGLNSPAAGFAINGIPGAAANAAAQGIKNSFTTPAQAQPTAPTAQPTVTSPTVTIPRITPIKPTPFKLDTSNVTSDHFGTNNSYNSVLASVPTPLSNPLATYQANAPTPQQYAQATAFSPEQQAAQQNLLTQKATGRQIQQNYLGGVQNVMGRPEAMDFQQGQEAALTRQNALLGGQQALNTQAATDQANYQENIRQNNIAAINAQQTGAQNLYGNQLNAANYGLQAQQVLQGRYEYQQITDPNTGFPTIQIIDKQTGLPAGNIAPGSPQAQQLAQSGQLGRQQTPGVVAGYDISSYATDPNHEAAVSGIYNEITQATQAIGGVQNVDIANQVIGQLSPNSPVTGAMVISAANKYGVDPALIISIMQQDSSLGTAGKGAKTYNPGNVGNDDAGNTKNFGSWDKGVNAVAEWLANHRDTGQVATNGEYSQVAAQAPAQLQSSIKSLPDGTAYVDSNSVPSQFAVMANNFATKNGIKVLNTQDANAVSTINQSIKNMQTLSNTFADLASSGAFGAITSNITDPFSKLASTNYGSQLKSYQANREGLFQQIRALAGSSPRLNGQELNTAASSMPTLDALNKDTLKDGINKLVKTQTYLDNAIKTFIPNYSGTPVQVGNQYAILGPDGKAYVFTDRNAAIQALKLK